MPTIPFVRHFPNGRRVMTTIDRPRPIRDLASVFIHAGGRYRITISPDNIVHLQAILKHSTDRDAEEVECAVDECTNDASLPHHIDALVEDSVKWLAVAGHLARRNSIITNLH